MVASGVVLLPLKRQAVAIVLSPRQSLASRFLPMSSPRSCAIDPAPDPE